MASGGKLIIKFGSDAQQRMTTIEVETKGVKGAACLALTSGIRDVNNVPYKATADMHQSEIKSPMIRLGGE